MTHLRRTLIAAVLIAGLALAVLIHGPLRLAVALLILDVFILVWSIALLRFVTQTSREKNT